MNLRTLSFARDGFCRRAFVQGAAAAFLGLRASSSLRAADLLQDPVTGPPVLGHATARHVIYLFMRGGMSQLDTFDPKPGAPTQGPVDAISTRADGIQLSQHFPFLARQMDKACLVRSLSSTQGAHAQAQYLMRTSYDLRGTIQHPSLGAWAHRLAGRLNRTLPGHVIVGGNNMPSGGFFPPQFQALPIGDATKGLQNSKLPPGIDEARFQTRLDRLAEANKAFDERHRGRDVRAYSNMYEDAVRLMRSSDLAAFDTEQEPESIRAAYGDGAFGRGCLLARRLVEHGVRYVEVTADGWDTHNDNFDELGDKLPAIDRGLAALIADLDARGLLDRTLVVLATEFGRTPEITGNNGRNHYPKAFSALLAGGGVKRGYVHGATDAQGREVVGEPVSIQDFNATIAYALGLPLDHVVMAPSGRPFKVADKGQPVVSLFA